MNLNKRNDYLRGIESVESTLGHEIAKVYSPAYYLLNSLEDDSTLDKRQRFIASFAKVAMIFGILYTPTKSAYHLFPKDAQSLSKLAWHIFLVKNVFGECFCEEMLDKWLTKIIAIWDLKNKIIKFPNPEIFDYLCSIELADAIRIMQILLIVLYESINQYMSLSKSCTSDLLIREISKFNFSKNSIVLSAELPSSANNQKLSLEISSYDPDVQENWYWKYSAGKQIDDICNLLYLQQGKNYDRNSIFSYRREAAGFVLKCKLDLFKYS